MSTDTTPQPNIDLAGLKPGDRVKQRNGEIVMVTEFISRPTDETYPFEIRPIGLIASDGKYYYGEQKTERDIIAILPDPRDEEISRLKNEISDFEFIRNGNMPWAEKAQEYLDSGRWGGLPLMQGLITELQERDQQLTAANAKVTMLEKKHDAFVLNMNYHSQNEQQIAQLIKERDRLRDEKWTRISQLEKELDAALKQSEKWVVALMQSDATHDAELARVLTEVYDMQPDSAATVLARLSLTDRFRWNGEAFEANHSTCDRKQFERKEICSCQTKPTHYEGEIPCPKFLQKAEPERSYVMPDNGDTKRREEMAEELRKIANSEGVWATRQPVCDIMDGGKAIPPAQPDPLDAPVTRRELRDIFRESAGLSSLPIAVRLRELADALERSAK